MTLSAGERSEVTTTATVRAIPSAPRFSSMNSRTSRPRSPTRQITFTSALTRLASMPSSVDLPTPEPAMTQTRWPLPMGIRPSMARTPVSNGSRMRRRCMGFGGTSVTRRRRRVRSGGPPSMGRPSPSTTRPMSSSPTGTVMASSRHTTDAP